MSVLKSIESKIAGLVEGTFSRAFRSEVRPVEIARRLAREMEEHKTVSISRTYVPNEYGVYLSPADRERLEGVEDGLVKELSAYLLEHARTERLAFVSAPVIEFRTDEQLSLGEFGIQARLVRPAEDPASEPSQGEVGHTMIYSTAEPAGRDAEQRGGEAARARRSPGEPVLLVDGRRVVVPPDGAVLGRSRDCDVVLHDANVSRHHAELRPAREGWSVRDLGSTNGVKLNGSHIEGRTPISPGDAIELGTTELRF